MYKKGLDYFPIEEQFWKDDKIAYVTYNYPENGEIIIIKLLSKIYFNEGYFCTWDKLATTLFSQQYCYGKIDKNYIQEVVSCLLDINFFDKEKYKKYSILTSKSIQKRYLNASKRRKEANNINPIYVCNCLFDDKKCMHESTNNSENVYTNKHTTNRMYTKTDRGEERIGEERIGENSIGEDKEDIVESKKQIPPLPNSENKNFKINIPLDEDGCPDLTYYDTDEYKQKLAEMNNQSNLELTKKEPKKFIPPTKEEILCFANEKNLDNDVDAFFDYYESNGWKVGKNKMVKWKNAYNGWVSRNKKYSNKTKQDSSNDYQSNRYVNNDFENVTYETVYNTD